MSINDIDGTRSGRRAAAMGLFFLINLIFGGYYDASLLPFLFVNIAFLVWPSGLWLGLDRKLARRYPGSRWFGSGIAG